MTFHTGTSIPRRSGTATAPGILNRAEVDHLANEADDRYLLCGVADGSSLAARDADLERLEAADRAAEKADRPGWF